MAICQICDDSGLLNSDSENPQFCYCAAGKQARRQWEQPKDPQSPSFIDIAQLEQVNANVDAMRASLFGSQHSPDLATPHKHPVVQLLYRVGRSGHQVSMSEAAQLHDLARALESWLIDLSLLGRKKGSPEK